MPARACHLPLPVLLLCLLSFGVGLHWSGPVEAQVRRCTMADGHTLHTDRRCEDLGATERVPRDQASALSRLPYRGGCARQLQDLIFEVTTAIDAQDANRLASVYHWPGLSSRAGYAVVGRLEAIARRPLVDIRTLAPAPPAAEPGFGADASMHDGDDYSQTTARRTPVGLRLEQTLTDGVTPSRTTFGLRRHMGCWWVSL
ncbi:hypothetical protein BH23PSE2_BH23PSE2_10070 [soil metagenome]